MAVRGRDPILTHLEWLRLRGHRPSSVEARRNALLRMTRLIGKELVDLTADDLDGWQRQLRIGPASRSNYVSHARAFFEWAVQEGYLIDDPSTRLVSPRLPRRLPRPISEESLAAAILTAPERIRPMLVLAGWAGLRAREIAYLRREDVLENADPPMLVVVDGKGGHQRTVPLGRTVRDALAVARLPARGWLFTRRDGQSGPNKPWMVSHLCNCYLHSIDIPETLHQLRHRFGTATYRASNDLRVVQELLGHAHIGTTTGYVAYHAPDAVAAVTALDG